MPYKSKEDRREYMREYRRKKKIEQEQIAIREKNRIADLSFKRLAGTLTLTELVELDRLEAKYYPVDKEYEADEWGTEFLDPDLIPKKDPGERDPEPSPNEEYLSPLRYGKTTPGKTIFVDLEGKPIKPEKKKKSAWEDFWGEEP